LEQQLAAPALAATDRMVNVSGGAASAMSLRQISDWCAREFGAHEVLADGAPRPFDIPWIVLDHAKAARLWSWRPQTPVASILGEIAAHARAHPEWLDLSAPL
jgi:CDP-paratose 2-epimerase